MPNPLDSNEGGIGFLDLPWSITKSGLIFVLARVFEEGPCGAICVCRVCVSEEKMELSSCRVKLCCCFLLETLGD